MSFASIIDTLDSFLWGWPLIILLFGTHIFMTIRTGFIQKDIFKAIRLSVTKDPDARGRRCLPVRRADDSAFFHDRYR